ncbi:MAG: SDR family NAD(P)-dependent oxidoreductase [Erysipelotrichaceae bacterium]|nr:SDR family NAD(P)-dependent oxidoreductase [Erysipelotrichaceae bacterium]
MNCLKDTIKVVMKMKWTLITGAAGGLGQAFCRQYAASGCNLLVQGRSFEQLNTLKIELMKEYSVRIEICVCDFTNNESFKEFSEFLGKYHIERLICNAGFGSYGLFAEADANQMIQMHQVNMDVLMKLNHLVVCNHAESIKEIINVASTASFQPGPWMSVYYATKAYVLSFSQALSIELKSKGIRVCALCCGPMETGFSKRAQLKHTWMQKMVMVTPDYAVKCAMKGLKKGKSIVVPGFMNRMLVSFSSFMPSSLRLSMMSLIQSRRK